LETKPVLYELEQLVSSNIVKGKLKGGRAWKINMTVKHLFMSSLLAWFLDALGVQKGPTQVWFEDT
jgi:hypothetical protein